MKQWFDTIAQLERKGESYVVLTIIGTAGSTPRNAGTKMVVSRDDNCGTIGGGHLEFQAIEKAHQLLRNGETTHQIESYPLGARLGQCCGGSVSVLFECFCNAKPSIALFGAGHVGRALSTILAELPCTLHWIDEREQEFPAQLPSNAQMVISDAPAQEIAALPANTYYVVMTHNHGLDFAICEAVLERGDARYIGLIGSHSKWEKFQQRFQHRGYEPAWYQQVHCPIGLAAVPGKRPMEVAVAVAAQLIAEFQADLPARPSKEGVRWHQVASHKSDPTSAESVSAGTN